VILSRRAVFEVACGRGYGKLRPFGIREVSKAGTGGYDLRHSERTGCDVRTASASARKGAGEKLQRRSFPGRFHLRLLPGLEISLRKRKQMQRTRQRSGTRPKHDQRRERPHRAAESRPDPFGLRGSLPPLAARKRSSCFGRGLLGNSHSFVRRIVRQIPNED
jgi:hypothetical protein